MRIITSFILLMIFLVFNSCVAKKINTENHRLQHVLSEPTTLLVDVRTPEEFSEGSVKNAINIPLSEVENEIAQFKDKKAIVIFCRSGNRAEKAKTILRKHKIKNVFNGGSWENVRNLKRSINSGK